MTTDYKKFNQAQQLTKITNIIECDETFYANFQSKIKEFIDTAFLGDAKSAFQIYPWMKRYAQKPVEANRQKSEEKEKVFIEVCQAFQNKPMRVSKSSDAKVVETEKTVIRHKESEATLYRDWSKVEGGDGCVMTPC